MHMTSEDSEDIILNPQTANCIYTNAVNRYTVCFYHKHNNFGYTY